MSAHLKCVCVSVCVTQTQYPTHGGYITLFQCEDEMLALSREGVVSNKWKAKETAAGYDITMVTRHNVLHTPHIKISAVSEKEASSKGCPKLPLFSPLFFHYTLSEPNPTRP